MNNFYYAAAGYYLALSLLLLVLFFYDKRQARQRRRRVPERTLLLLGFAGGMCGGLAGMSLFHHKTRKRYFALCYIASLALHAALWCFIVRGGAA